MVSYVVQNRPWWLIAIDREPAGSSAEAPEPLVYTKARGLRSVKAVHGLPSAQTRLEPARPLLLEVG